MHELGIVTHVAKTLDETAVEHKITKIGSVTLEIGEVSGIITDYFIDCWNYFKVRHPVLAESELKIETIPAVTYCTSCRGRYETVKYGIECPYCHSRETYLIQGNECTIKEIEAETDDEADETEV
jgi:hydrogenase nickel incorporation protein HypA/HybF